ncbi:MAG: carotenoid 1,2-hydratase [Pseudomonadota bacterium]
MSVRIDTRQIGVNAFGHVAPVQHPMCLQQELDNGVLLNPRSDFFSAQVPDFGYRWWYLDVVSPDKRIGVVVIGFIGSVFSPYYAASRRRGHGDPFNHCAINAIIYSPRKKYWAMTERTADQLAINNNGISVGPSAMRWRNGQLIADINEICNPWPGRLRGSIMLDPGPMNSESFSLHENDCHHWWPVAPLARANVAFTKPSLSFTGSAYLDSNFGSEPLETGFDCWDWTRREHPVTDGVTPALTYHVTQRDTKQRSLALAIDAQAGLHRLPEPPAQPLPRTGWRVDRMTRSAAPIAHVRTLEDTPFYARSMIEVGADPTCTHTLMHESLSLQRFSKRWVQTLLPFRMPRRNTAG